MSKALVLSLKNNKIHGDDEILLGGEWVLENQNIEKRKLNYKIFNSKSSLKEIRRKNCVEADKIYQELFIDLSKELNSLHSINLSLNSWKIIFGSWLKVFVSICYERNYLISEILENNEISKIYGTKNKKFKFYSGGTFEQRSQAVDHSWNNNLFYEIINYYNFPIKKDFLDINETKCQNIKQKFIELNLKSNTLKKNIFKLFNRLKILRKKNDALITKTGLPFFYEKIFEILHFQVPQNYDEKKINYKNFDEKKRSKIKLFYGEEKNIKNFIRKNLSNFLPICVVESFDEIYRNCEKNFPLKPKFIMTAYACEYDVNFKFYTAKKVNEKTPYFLFQHGNNYFTDDFVLNRIEYETSKKFFSFGYNKNKIAEGFCNQLTLGKKVSFNKEGNLHIVSPYLPSRIASYEQSVEYVGSYKNIYDFEKKLDLSIKRRVLLRLTTEFLETDRGRWYFDTYFKNFKEHQIDFGTNNYLNNLRNARLNLFFYDSTGILENLIYNIPTIGIWNNLYNHIEDEFVDKYKFLKEANIIFDNVDALLTHLKNIWNNPSEWWFSKKTQKNIEKFNSNFNNKGNILSLLKLRKKIMHNLK